jgi:hypothetical protein
MADCRCSMGILTGCANDVIGLHENIGWDWMEFVSESYWMFMEILGAFDEIMMEFRMLNDYGACK